MPYMNLKQMEHLHRQNDRAVELEAALRKLVDAACLDGCPFKQNGACLPCGRCTTCHKTAAAIAEAERLLNESEAKDE